MRQKTPSESQKKIICNYFYERLNRHPSDSEILEIYNALFDLAKAIHRFNIPTKTTNDN